MLDTLPLNLQIEAKNVSDEGRFTGLASAVGVLDQGGDIVAPGAFKGSLAEHLRRGTRVAMFRDHNPAQPIGVWESLAETAKGLEVVGRLTRGVQIAEETLKLLRDQALTGLSIGYRTRVSTQDRKTGTRIIEQLDLIEISIVSLPMNIEARVTGVKAAERIKDRREYERWLRDAGGFSRNKAKALASAFEAGPATNHSTDISSFAAQIRARAAVHERISK